VGAPLVTARPGSFPPRSRPAGPSFRQTHANEEVITLKDQLAILSQRPFTTDPLMNQVLASIERLPSAAKTLLIWTLFRELRQLSFHPETPPAKPWDDLSVFAAAAAAFATDQAGKAPLLHLYCYLDDSVLYEPGLDAVMTAEQVESMTTDLMSYIDDKLYSPDSHGDHSWGLDEDEESDGSSADQRLEAYVRAAVRGALYKAAGFQPVRPRG
jgi:hypothetical protein